MLKKITKLKIIFSFLPFLFFLFPSFFFFPYSSQFVLVPVQKKDVRTYDSDSWISSERQKTLSVLQRDGTFWWEFTAFGLKKLEFKTKDGKDVIFYFDKLATAFQLEILKQKIFSSSDGLNPADFDFTKIQDEARKQLLQPYKPYQKDSIEFVDGFSKVIFSKMDEYGNIFLESIRSSLLKMKTLGLSEVDVSHKTQYDISAITTKHNNLENVLYKQTSIKEKMILAQFAFSTFSSTPNNAKNILDNVINKIWTPWLHTLQSVNGFGLTSLTVNKVQIDVSSLVNSKVQEASDLSLDQIKILKNLQPLGLEKLNSQIEAWINPRLNSYKNSIQKGLEILVPTEITKIEVSKIIYPVDLLLLKTNLDKKVSEWTNDVKNQLLVLKKAKITSQDLVKVFQNIEARKIPTFQTNWDAGKVSTYLLWLPIFDIQEVKLSQNEILPVTALANAIKDMLLAEKFNFTKLEGKTRKELFNLLNIQGKFKEEKTFQDDVWRQIKNSSKWKTIEEPAGELSLQLIKTLLVKVQELGIEKIDYPFFPKGYDLSFLQDNPDWKTISFKNLLAGMTIKINGTNVEFYSSLFPNKVVFQVPMKKLDTVFSEITIISINEALSKAISDNSQQEKKLESKNQGLIIGLSVGGGILFLSSLGGFLYWFFKIKK